MLTDSKFKASTPFVMVHSTLFVRKPQSHIPPHRISLALNNYRVTRRLGNRKGLRLKQGQPAHFRAQPEKLANSLGVSLGRPGAKEEPGTLESCQRWKVRDDGVPIELLGCR